MNDKLGLLPIVILLVALLIALLIENFKLKSRYSRHIKRTFLVVSVKGDKDKTCGFFTRDGKFIRNTAEHTCLFTEEEAKVFMRTNCQLSAVSNLYLVSIFNGRRDWVSKHGHLVTLHTDKSIGMLPIVLSKED